MELIDVTGTLVIDNRVTDWCRYPYPDHPKGCPNWDKHDRCPPKVRGVADVFDLSQQHWFAIIKFDLGAHADRMAGLHKNWSDRQCRCLLYWQRGVKKNLEEYCWQYIRLHAQMTYTLCPEGMGVNVFRTAHRHGIRMRKNPQKTVHFVALIGTSNENDEQNEGLLQWC